MDGSVAMSITLEDLVVPETEACHSQSEMSVKSQSDVFIIIMHNSAIFF